MMDAVFLYPLRLEDKEVSSTMTEKELIEGCGRGNNQARKQLYEQYAGQLMAVCVRYTGDSESARDVLHDAFLNIFRSFDRFTSQGEGSLTAWMTRIAVNESLNYLRRKTATHREVLVEQLPDAADEEAEEDLQQIPPPVLMRFIRELPDGYRTVFNLHVFERKPHKEIARMLGISEHSSSSQFHRAKMWLQKKITEFKKKNDYGRKR